MWSRHDTCQRAKIAVVGFAAATALAAPASAADPTAKPGETLSIEDILRSGWDVSGYVSNNDNRSTFILFKKVGENYLIQCLVGYDVTRQPRVFRNCYELR